MQLTFRAIGEQLKVLCFILYTVCSTVVNAENTCEPEVSRLISAQGHVDAYLAQASQWSSAQQGQPYCGDDKVRTGALSRAVLSMEKGIATFLALDQLTLLNFVKNAGRVVVASNTGPVREVVEHGVNGLLFDFFDAPELARQVVDVLGKPVRYRAIGDNARHTVIDRYDLLTKCLPAQVGLITG